jgi:hypothetical protein
MTSLLMRLKTKNARKSAYRVEAYGKFMAQRVG